MKLRTLLIAALASLISATLALQAQVPGINSTLDTVFTLAYDNSSMKQTYSATTIHTPVSGANDVCSLSGSATKTVKVRRIIFSGNHTTAQADPLAVVKRSTAYTAGAGSAMTQVAYDSQNASATVNMAEAWTGNPTAGTLVGVLADVQYFFGLNTSALQPSFTFEFGKLGQPLVLRGIAQQVAINLSGFTYSGLVSCTFEWTEE